MEAWPNFDTSLDPEQPRPTGVAQAASQANADLGASRPSVLLLGAGLPILGLARHGPGEFTTVGGQRLADGHVPGHIGQPPGRGPGRPPQPLEGGLGVQPYAAISTPLACSISQ
jgi:hypothetical protein